MYDNINGQAEHSNERARNSPQGGVTQRRRVPITLVIPTLPGLTATNRQELGLNDLGTGNGMLQNAPFEPAQDFDDPALFGVLQTNHHWTTPPCPQDADNFINFGISSVANF